MKTSKTYALAQGARLTLKSDRQSAYAKPSPDVKFVRLQTRDGYATPFIVAEDSRGELGHYRPSDFKS